MRSISKICVGLLLAFSLGLVAPGNQIEFTEFDLDNGLHVILHEDHTTPNVAVTVLYHVGSKNESADRTGFAHFFEHLLFEGSENIERGEFDSYVENAGGMLNANTSMDRTFYFELMPSNNLELALWLESERMMHAKVDEVGIETQRQVVKEEKRLRVDNRPYGSWLGEVYKRAYTKHPYRWQPIGSMEHLDAAQEEDYINFYKTYYVPNNATLSIAGDLSIAETKKLVEKYFSEIPKGKAIPRPAIKEPPLKNEKRGIIYDNISLPAVAHGFRIPEQGSKDVYALEMLAHILSRGESSRLKKNVVNDKQLAVQSISFCMALEDPGLFLTFAIANMGVAPSELEKAIDEEYERLQKELISEKELQKLQNIIENDFVVGTSSIAKRAEYLADYHVYFGNADLINKDINRYMIVTREDIRNAAQKYLVKTNRVSLQVLPKKESDDK